jgi:hypothetical protein
MTVHRQHFAVYSSFGVTIRHELLYPDPHPAHLLVSLPGRGYTQGHPLLHYLTDVGLAAGYAVLRVQYGFQVTSARFVPDMMPILWRESEQAIQQALEHHPYEHICWAGKSLGTPLAVSLAGTTTLRKSFLLLTPIQHSAEQTGTAPTLAVIGTADEVYKAGIDTTDTATRRWLVLDGLNHALERDYDWRASLDAMQQILGAGEDFLRAQR